VSKRPVKETAAQVKRLCAELDEKASRLEAVESALEAARAALLRQTQLNTRTIEDARRAERGRDEARAEIATLKRCIAIVEGQRDEARSALATERGCFKSAQDDAELLERERDEARSERDALQEAYTADVARLRAELAEKRARFAECLQDRDYFRAQLAARPEPVVINEALAKSLAEAYLRNADKPQPMLHALRSVLGERVAAVVEPLSQESGGQLGAALPSLTDRVVAVEREQEVQRHAALDRDEIIGAMSYALKIVAVVLNGSSLQDRMTQAISHLQALEDASK
jgi:hypothetical protein